MGRSKFLNGEGRGGGEPLTGLLRHMASAGAAYFLSLWRSPEVQRWPPKTFWAILGGYLGPGLGFGSFWGRFGVDLGGPGRPDPAGRIRPDPAGPAGGPAGAPNF